MIHYSIYITLFKCPFRAFLLFIFSEFSLFSMKLCTYFLCLSLIVFPHLKMRALYKDMRFICLTHHCIPSPENSAVKVRHRPIW
jgi:hypothetical protein